MKHFEAAFERLPDRARRSAAWSSFRRLGLPSTRLEEWHYTDLSPLLEQPFELAEPTAAAIPELPGADTVAFVNGRLVAGNAPLLDPTRASHEEDGVRALNAAFASGGLDLDVAPAQATNPLHLYTWFGGQSQRMAHLRHRIHVQRGGSAVVILQEAGDEASFFATQVFEIQLDDNAQLSLYRIQQPGRGTTSLSRIDVRLGRDSRFASACLHSGGALLRTDLNVSLTAPGADAQLRGVLVPVPGEHLDVRTRVDHRASHGRSREMYRALVPEKARAIFNGKVVVHPDAQKTDSEQQVDSLLLAPGAEVNAKPELEIYADDVKCAHGATCGQLDESAVYYLRSRGLDLAAARNLLLYTFGHEILQHMAFESARRLAEETLLARLPGAPRLEELR